MQAPGIGRIVWYRSRTGKYTVPAIINATTETLAPEGVASGNVPALSSDMHVHLTVFSPGKPGCREGADDFLVESEHGRAENVGGVYQEWDVVLDDRPLGSPNIGAEPEQAPGTWRWPVIG